MNPLLSALSTAGDVLDMPGSYLRGALSGRPGERASGRDMLQSWGVAGENQPGLDWGDVGGFGAEMVLDPLSLAAPALGAFKGIRGIQAGTRAAQALSHSDDANPLVKAMAGFAGEESGALRPFMEIGRRTDPDYVNSVPWWHGTATPGLTPETLDPMKTDPGGLFGRGIYKTADPNIAGGPGGYAEARMAGAGQNWAREAREHIWPEAAQSPERAREINQRLLDTARSIGVAPARIAYLEERMLKDASRPSLIPSFLDTVNNNPERIAAFHNAINEIKPGLRGMPSPTVYEANTNLGKIMDLDAPPTPEVIEAFRAMHGYSSDPGFEASLPWRMRFDPSDTTEDMIKKILGHHVPGGGDLEEGSLGLIQGLRQAGYDALSHTGGLRAGGGNPRNLHQVLISLDPNDTISNVGRSGQITRFEPQDIKALLERFAR